MAKGNPKYGAGFSSVNGMSMSVEQSHPHSIKMYLNKISLRDIRLVLNVVFFMSFQLFSLGSPFWCCLISGGKDEIVRYAFDLI